VAVDLPAERPASARLRVVDNGPGIPAEFRDQVFRRFFRLDGSDHTGSGLGLSIVREIVHGHGGEIALNDAPDGQGLLVEVFLPLAGTAVDGESQQKA
jgi:signal transduction histidine kinase